MEGGDQVEYEAQMDYEAYMEGGDPVEYEAQMEYEA